MNGDKISYTYRAATDSLSKRWHLGSLETLSRQFCGVPLAPSTEAGLKLDADLTLIDCGACKRTARYKTDVQKWGVDADTGPRAEPASDLPAAAKVPAARKPRVKAKTETDALIAGLEITTVPDAALRPVDPEPAAKPAARKRPSRAKAPVDGSAVKHRDEVTGELTWRLVEVTDPKTGADLLLGAVEAATGETLGA
jgi:hypothetical protein